MRTPSFVKLPHLFQKFATLVSMMWYGLFIALLVGTWPQPALAQLSCPATQLTSSGFSDFTSLNATGTLMVFMSTADLTGENPDGSFEVFLYDTAADTFTQITDTPGNAENRGVLSSNGTRIAITSNADLTGSNPDGSSELFLFNIATNTFTQITDTTGGSFAHRFGPAISINADGTRVAFIFDRDLTGANADLNGEVFLFDTTTSTITQITNTVGSFQLDPWISGSGTRIVFSSSAGRTEFCPGGCADLFLFDTTTNTTTQITQATGRTVQHGSISADGTRIGFSSDADLTGGNPEHSSKIFLFDTTTNSFTQITSSPGEFPVISADGTHIVYRGNGLLLFDTTTNTTTQVFGDINFGPAGINDDGSRVSFAANSSVWLAICPAGTDLSLTKTDSPDPVLTGKNLTYTLTVSNAGPSAVGDAVLNDPLPANTTFQSLTAPAGWSCTTPAVGSTGTVNCGPASLAAGATASFTLVVKVSNQAGGTTLSNTATIASATADPTDPNMGNNSDTETTVVTKPAQALKLTVQVKGKGSVTSSPPGINTCTASCSATYNSGTQVTLTATAASGYLFTGWSGGGCQGTGTCVVTVTADTKVTATFTKQ